MALSSGTGGGVSFDRGSPYRSFAALVLCIAGAALALFSLQSFHGPAPASGAPVTIAPEPTVVPPTPLVPGAPRARPKTGKPQPSPVEKPAPAPSAPTLAAIEAEIVRLTNVERAAEGLAPLTHDAALDAIARAHSRDMIARAFFSHENPSGDGPTERAEKAGYDVHKRVPEGELVGIGENIGMTPTGEVEDIGFVEREAHSIAAAQIRGWMARRGHRANILSEDYEKIGVGVAYDGKGVYTCTQVFW